MLYADHVAEEMLASHASDGMLLFTAVLAIIIGIVLAFLGKKGNVLWMFVWSIGLIVCSLSMGVYLLIQPVS